MQFNNIQSNNTHNASFAPNSSAANQPQQGAQPQARVLPPLADAADLANNPAARNLQAYNPISIPQGSPDPLAPDTWNAPEYQPIQPGAPYMEKLADEAMNTKKLNIYLKNARDNEELEDFPDAEEAYEKALKYTENAEHYKLYAGCLREIYLTLSKIPLTPAKDEAKERLYKEKAARAFYYLGNLYQKQGAWKEAQAAYRASSELALYEAPLKALVDVARHLEETMELAHALEKLADFYAEKGAIALAIDKFKEAFEIGKSAQVLEKLDALYSKAGGEDSQSQIHEVAIQRFELQISQDPKNIGVYRDYAWFLKDIGRKGEARVVKKRMDAVLQEKLIKQKTKIGGLKQTIQLQDEKLETQGKQLECLEKQVLHLDFSRQNIQDTDLISILNKNPYTKVLNLRGCKNITDAGLAPLARLTQLTSLNLWECGQLTDAGLQHLVGLTGLSHLGLAYYTQLTNAGLQHLSGLVHLTLLDLGVCQKITDAGLQHLVGLTQLDYFSLSHCIQVTDAGLQYLTGLTRLTTLHLAQCQLTDAGLQHLAGLSQLKELYLNGCTQLTDAGLQHLAGLSQLRALHLSGCKNVSSNAKEQLKRQIPGLTIHG